MYINVNRDINKAKIHLMYEMTKLIHNDSDRAEYQLDHVRLVAKYIIELSAKFKIFLPYDTVQFIAYGHDLLKDKFFDKKLNTVMLATSDGIMVNIPQNLNWYVRANMDILEKYKLEDYFNSDCQLHALASGIFCDKFFHIHNPKIIYPIIFHSCPIISVYETLSPDIQQIIQIVMLADKLSSNTLKKNMGRDILCDLQRVVFGKDGREFNFSLGLYMARLIASGNNPGKESAKATSYFYQVLKETNPLLPNKEITNVKEFREFIK